MAYDRLVVTFSRGPFVPYLCVVGLCEWVAKDDFFYRLTLMLGRWFGERCG